MLIQDIAKKEKNSDVEKAFYNAYTKIIKGYQEL